MDLMALLGIIAIVYAGMVLYIAIKRPEAVWNMAKINLFKRVLGEKGTVVFFCIWALLFIALGIWLISG